MMETSVLVVILNWNSLALTRRCVASVYDSDYNDFSILVIDNGSEEDPSSIMKTEFPQILVLKNDNNRGVATARNQGMRIAIEQGYDFVLFLDNDARVDKKMISRLLVSAKQNPSAGLLGPKILKEGSQNVIWRAGCLSWKWTYLHAGHEIVRRLFGIFGYLPPKILDTLRAEGKQDYGQYDREENVSFQIGCTQLVRREVIRDVGMLDEEFSPYGSEDIDYCARLTRYGWKVRYVPGAVCWHDTNSSFRDEFDRAYHNTKNILLLARKNLAPSYFWMLFVPDYILLTLPLILTDTYLKRTPLRRSAILAAVRWNIRDCIERGVILKQQKEDACIE